MELQTALPRIFLLLLLLQFQGSFSHPLDEPRQARELTGVQELLDRLREKISALEELESAEPESREQRETLEELWENSKPEPQPVPGGSRGFRVPAFQTLRSLQSPKLMRESGCFGRRLDRIGSLSSLGCNVSRRN
ncbi:natriuretic peptides B isoform X2 [Monodelphis domestica]|uniref:natriuretic peptides B isoform X2 n=1 Tax=Monodelphis domestica TaxID=13616 RepID=UPI0024E22E7F|nr:natriuretic peptides B isoform X2 [Monodelphis domestica]